MSNNSGSATSFEVEINTEYRTAVRFPAWMVLTVFSAVSLVSLAARIKADERGSEERWAMAVTSLSTCVGLLGCAAYLFIRGIYVGQIPEAVMIALVLAFWGFGLPAIMNPDNAIAVRAIEVDNANLYFSSWISFASAVFLAGSLAQETMGLDLRTVQSKQTKWFALVAASLVVLFASVRIYKNDDVQCGGPQGADSLAGTEFCKRTKLGISLGVLTFISSLGFSFGAALLPFAGLLELALTSVLLIMWVFGVGFITFGGDLSPGTHIGNLYFATWISFGLVVS
mmetsp:Transcript_4198/g.8555  ORF Transcript_4198/g.8555 Transcript_4198/m.8555 type:complete len:284 (-) Transcript_4198:370-1221(-)